MNKFGLHTFGLPSFGISDFRLTSFGGDGDGGRKAALPSPDLYYDLSLKSNEHPTRNIIDDMSGNGRHATIYNALYAKGSGYGKYAEDFMSWVYDTTDSAGLEIEGRNLLRDSEIERHNSASDGEFLQIANIVSIYDKYGEGTYTFSFDAKSDVVGTMGFYSTPGNSNDFKYVFTYQSFQITTEYKRYTFTVDVHFQNPDSKSALICLYGSYGTGRKPWVKNIKVELGNKATPWSPAPEDQVSDLNIERTSEKVTIFANEAGVPQYCNFGTIGLKEFNISFKTSVDCNLIVQTRKFGDSTLLQESTQIIADTLYHMSFETLDASEYAQRWVYFTSPIKYPLTITQIPEYEGAFVFDGIDDYARIENITKGFKTLFMEVVPFKTGGILFDQRMMDAVQVGGRNLVKNTKERTLTPKNDGTASDNYNYEHFLYDGKPNTTYTLSFESEVTHGEYSAVTIRGAYPEVDSVIVELNLNGRTKHTFTTPQNTSATRALVYAGVSGATRGNGLILRNIKIEEGNKATDWTPAPEDVFAISNLPNTIAYNERNPNGVTYINGELNTNKYTDDMQNHRQVITIVNPTDTTDGSASIGAAYNFSEDYSSMALYKVIGFYDELTPAQIQKVITKYNLKYEQI